jgi:hypothetical protein
MECSSRKRSSNHDMGRATSQSHLQPPPHHHTRGTRTHMQTHKAEPHLAAYTACWGGGTMTEPEETMARRPFATDNEGRAARVAAAVPSTLGANT